MQTCITFVKPLESPRKSTKSLNTSSHLCTVGLVTRGPSQIHNICLGLVGSRMEGAPWRLYLSIVHGWHMLKCKSTANNVSENTWATRL